MKWIFNIGFMICMVAIIGNAFGQAQGANEEHQHGSGKDSCVIFSHFPLHNDDYLPDVQEIMDRTIDLYGEEEWKLVVLTSELHGHLGIYAIIGAKMGLYAREILGAGQDELVIVSYAGSRPPLSCLNDGLQASTGSTLGHGLITIKEIEDPIPEAVFSYNGKTARIRLNDPAWNQIEQHIKHTLEQTGGITPEYWHKVRKLGIEVWMTYNRQEVFDVE